MRRYKFRCICGIQNGETHTFVSCIYTDNANSSWIGGFGGGGVKVKGKKYPGPEGKGISTRVKFEIHSDLAHRCTLTRERNETTSRLD